MELTPEQMEAVKQGRAVEMTVEQTECVLLRKDIFARIQPLLYDGGDWTPEETTRLAWEAGKSIGWEEASMEVYDEYEKHKP